MKIDRGDWSNGLRYMSINDIILGLVYRCWLDIISVSDLLDQDSILNALFTIYTYTQTNLNIQTKYVWLYVSFFCNLHIFFFLFRFVNQSSYFTPRFYSRNLLIPSSTLNYFYVIISTKVIHSLAVYRSRSSSHYFLFSLLSSFNHHRNYGLPPRGYTCKS